MNKKVICTLLVLLLLCGTLVGCSTVENSANMTTSSAAESATAPTASNASSGTSSKSITRVDASIAICGFDALIKECPTIVRGKITKPGQSREVTFSSTKDETTTIVRTYYEVEVSELFQGDKKHAEKTTFWALGGETDTKIFIVNNNADQPKVDLEQFFFIFDDGSYYAGNLYLKDQNRVLPIISDWNEFSEKEPAAISDDEFAELLRNKIAASKN